MSRFRHALIAAFVPFFLGCIDEELSRSRQLLAETVDIAEQLAAIPGMIVQEIADSPPDYRQFALTYVQPVDHEEPDGAVFRQSMWLVHRSADAPMVFQPLGYMLNNGFSELTGLLDGNQLSVEHRFFGSSRPQSDDMTKLTIAQAAADHHRIVRALRPLYRGAWLSTGVSKGGMTSVYHRRFYPDDVDGTVAYVAPNSYGTADIRYARFLRRIGDAECRERMHSFQREALHRRASLAPMAEAWARSLGASFEQLEGGAVQALDVVTAEFWFTFWQYSDASQCAAIPTAEATDQELFGFLNQSFAFYFMTDFGFNQFGAYYYQAMTQIGYPKIPTGHLRGLLLYSPNDPDLYVPDVGRYDWAAAIDIGFWVLAQSESMLFIYGENDPWTAGQFYIVPNNPRDTHKFIAKDGNHGAKIADLSPADQATALQRLEQWTGVAARQSTIVGTGQKTLDTGREWLPLDRFKL